MSESVALVAVASASYRAFAEALMASADEQIDGEFTTHILDGIEGWPEGTECRHGIFADWLATADYDVAFLLDADLLVTEPFALTEILPPTPGIVATLHPGYVGLPGQMLPYEDRPECEAYVDPSVGEVYYAGGVVGGTRKEILRLSQRIEAAIAWERRLRGRSFRWHDESVLNRELTLRRPVLTLSPAYAHPENDAYYVRDVWGGETYPRRITALDKLPELRVGR